MKKLIILSCVLMISNKLFAQTTIYTQDFGAGVPAGWAITDSTGLGKVWTYTTVGPTGPAANPADTLKSTTENNGYMIMDDDFYGQAPGMNATAIITTAINCSAYNKVRVKFQEFYRHFAPAGSQGILYVSTDSINWTDVYHVEAGMANNAATANPKLTDINISTLAANTSTLYLKFLYRGDWGYYWEIDDIEVYEPAPAAINENNMLADVKFFPNPTKGIVTISGLRENVTLSVTNLQGQLILVKDLSINTFHLVDLNHEPEGIYHFKLTSKHRFTTETISILK